MERVKSEGRHQSPQSKGICTHRVTCPFRRIKPCARRKSPREPGSAKDRGPLPLKVPFRCGKGQVPNPGDRWEKREGAGSPKERT